MDQKTAEVPRVSCPARGGPAPASIAADETSAVPVRKTRRSPEDVQGLTFENHPTCWDQANRLNLDKQKLKR